MKLHYNIRLGREPIVMSSVRVSASLAVVLFCIPSQGQAFSLPRGAKKCIGVQAYAYDADSMGVNVRAEPDAKASVIGILKRQVFAKDAFDRPFSHAPRFDVIASYHGWLLVEGYAYPDQPEAILPATGWVHGSQVNAQSYMLGDPPTRLYQRKDGAVPLGALKSLSGMSFALLGCDGAWVEVQQRLWKEDGRSSWGIRGWLPSKDLCVEQPTRRKPINICDERP